MNNLRLFVRSRMTHLAVAGIAFYVTLAHYLPFAPVAEGWKVLQMSLSATVITAYWRRGMASFFIVDRWPPRTNLIALGIVISWASVCANGAWGLAWRLSGQPAWMVNNDWYNSWVAFNCAAACLHVIAPNLIGADVPREDKFRLGTAWLIAFVIMGVLTLYRPDLRPVTNVFKPYMQETRLGHDSPNHDPTVNN